MGSLNLNFGAPRFSGYLQNRRSCGLLFLFGAPVITDNGVKDRSSRCRSP